MRGLAPTDSEGTVEVLAHRDGTVILHSTCGRSRTTVRFDVCRAAQLSTGIWEAAGAAQHLTPYSRDNQPSPPQPPDGSEDLSQAWYLPPSTPPRARSPRRRRKLPPVNQEATQDATRTIGLRIRRIRESRNKSLQVISGLAGMSISTLHHVEYGRRELTLSEIVALANALEIDPTKLIILPTFTPVDRG